MATMMSVLDKVEERGIHKGLMQGYAEKSRGVAAAMHREGFPDDTIARITDEDVEVIRSWIREFEAGRDA